MARTSDSMPNLWSHLAGGERVTDVEGGAVVSFAPLSSTITRTSGLGRGIGVVRRTSRDQRWHLLFDACTQQCYTAHAVAVRMDLQARKAIALSEEDLASELHKQVQPL